MQGKMPNTISVAKAAILALAEVKAATEAFDRGESNAFDTMDAITIAVEAYKAATQPRRDAA